LTKGLFHNIIIESGPCAGAWGARNRSTGQAYGDVAIAGLPAPYNRSTLAELRAAPAGVIANASHDMPPSYDGKAFGVNGKPF